MQWLSNFFRSLMTVVIQWVSQAAALPWRAVKGVFRFTVALVSSLLDFAGSIARPALRFLAYVFLVVAVVSFVKDLTPVLSGTGPFRTTSLMEHWRSLAPSSLQQALTAIQGFAWGMDVIARWLLELPASLLFGVLGGLWALAGRKRERIEVFAN